MAEKAEKAEKEVLSGSAQQKADRAKGAKHREATHKKRRKAADA